MRRMDAISRNARAFSLRHSQSFANRRHRPSQASARSTTHRLGNTTKTFSHVGALDDLHIDLREDSGERLAELRPLITAVGIEFQQEWIKLEQRCQQHCTAIAI